MAVSRCRYAASARVLHAYIRTRAVDRYRRRVTRHRACARQRDWSLKGLRFLAPSSILSFSVIETDAIWNSISPYVYPMNNIAGVSKSRSAEIAARLE